MNKTEATIYIGYGKFLCLKCKNEEIKECIESMFEFIEDEFISKIFSFSKELFVAIVKDIVNSINIADKEDLIKEFVAANFEDYSMEELKRLKFKFGKNVYRYKISKLRNSKFSQAYKKLKEAEKNIIKEMSMWW